MDQRAAEEYHAALLKRLHKKSSALDRFMWIPLLGVAAYFAFDSIWGGVFGALLGWGVCAILSTLDHVLKEVWHVEFSRHLHEHTEEFEVGKMQFEIDDKIDRAVRRWWQF